MQGLRYAAVVEANIDEIGREAVDIVGVPMVTNERPVVQILAPKKWWRGWFQLEDSTRRKAGPWESKFAALVVDIESRLDVAVECLAMSDVQRAKLYDRPGEPTLPKVSKLYAVRLGERGVIGTPLPRASSLSDFGGEGRMLVAGVQDAFPRLSDCRIRAGDGGASGAAGLGCRRQGGSGGREKAGIRVSRRLPASIHAALRLCSRLQLHASIARHHSPSTFSRPRSRN